MPYPIVPRSEDTDVPSKMTTESRIQVFADVVPFIGWKEAICKTISQEQEPVEKLNLIQPLHKVPVEELTTSQQVIHTPKFFTY